MSSIQEIIAQKRAQNAQKQTAMMNSYRFKNGATRIRILPGWDKENPELFYHDFGQHWIKDFEGNVITTVGDSYTTYGRECEVRNAIEAAMRAAPTDEHKSKLKEMLAKPRILVNALILDDKDVSSTEPVLVEFSSTQFDQILAHMQFILEETGDSMINIEKGYDITIEKEGKGLSTKYNFIVSRKATNVPFSSLDKLINLETYVQSQFAAKMQKAIAAVRQLTGGANITVDPSMNNSLIEGNKGKVSDPSIITGVVMETNSDDLDAILADLDN
jgi:hypothetical protein